MLNTDRLLDSGGHGRAFPVRALPKTGTAAGVKVATLLAALHSSVHPKHVAARRRGTHHPSSTHLAPNSVGPTEVVSVRIDNSEGSALTRAPTARRASARTQSVPLSILFPAAVSMLVP